MKAIWAIGAAFAAMSTVAVADEATIFELSGHPEQMTWMEVSPIMASDNPTARLVIARNDMGGDGIDAGDYSTASIPLHAQTHGEIGQSPIFLWGSF